MVGTHRGVPYFRPLAEARISSRKCQFLSHFPGSFILLLPKRYGLVWSDRFTLAGLEAITFYEVARRSIAHFENVILGPQYNDTSYHPVANC